MVGDVPPKVEVPPSHGARRMLVCPPCLEYASRRLRVTEPVQVYQVLPSAPVSLPGPRRDEGDQCGVTPGHRLPKEAPAQSRGGPLAVDVGG